eukprot:107572_1
MSFMSNTGVFLIVTTIISIAFARVKNASFTCCYSNECPLSVFKQWSGEPLDVLSFSNYIIYETSCCPDNCKVYWGDTTWGSRLYDTKYGFNSTQFITGTLQTSCICNCPQTCDAITDDDTCDGSQYMTDTSCPDASVDDIDLIPNTMITTTTQGPQDNHIDYKCTYDPGTGVQRPMSQRCYPEAICIARKKVYDGSYTKLPGFYNGFVQYDNDIYVMRIELEKHGDSMPKRWIFRFQSNGTKAGSMPTIFFGIDYTKFGIKSSYVYEGACTPSPTAEPTSPTAPPTRKPTADPTLPTSDPTNRPTANPTPRPTAEPT